MTISRLTQRLDRMPILRLLVPFAAGTVLAEGFTLPLWFSAGAFVCAGVLAVLLRSSAWTLVLLVAAGFGSAQLRGHQTAIPLGVQTSFCLSIEGIPADRGRYSSVEAVVTAWRDPARGKWHAAHERIYVWADSLTHLCSGERIRCRGTIRPFRSGAQHFRALMARRGVAGSISLSERSLIERLPERTNSLHRRVVERFERLGLQGRAGAVVEAMTTGERSRITPQIRTDYSRSGFSHLLAVSGLHTGIVFVLLNALLWWMPLLRRGHIVRNAVVVAGIWLFVAAAGFPPSAIRAAVMCSVLQFSLASGSEYSALNSLSAAGLLMLLYNPAWIGDIGFQLSFAAVAGILAWGVPLSRRLRTRWRVGNTLTNVLVVSFAATAATAPLVSHTFGIVPLAGILLNPAAILLATVAVFAGAVWVVAPVGFAAPVVRFVAQYAAEGIDALARAAAAVPGGVVEYRLPVGPLVGIYLFFVAATLVAWCAEPKKSVHLPKK